MYLTNSVHRLLVLKRHEAETAMPLGLLVHQHDRLLHFPCNKDHVSQYNGFSSPPALRIVSHDGLTSCLGTVEPLNIQVTSDKYKHF